MRLIFAKQLQLRLMYLSLDNLSNSKIVMNITKHFEKDQAKLHIAKLVQISFPIFRN